MIWHKNHRHEKKHLVRGLMGIGLIVGIAWTMKHRRHMVPAA